MASVAFRTTLLYHAADVCTPDSPQMRIAIGSTRRPKVDAVRAVLERLAPLFGIPFDGIAFLTFDVSSGVDETPRSLEHLMTGARNRVDAVQQVLRGRAEHADLIIGLEGGLWRTDHTVFLQSWACVSDGSRATFGSSGAVPVSDAIAGAVLDRGESLSAVIDRLAERKDIRSHEGTWGVLTRDLLTRRESFETALLCALAPYYNGAFYRQGTP